MFELTQTIIEFIIFAKWIFTAWLFNIVIALKENILKKKLVNLSSVIVAYTKNYIVYSTWFVIIMINILMFIERWQDAIKCHRNWYYCGDVPIKTFENSITIKNDYHLTHKKVSWLIFLIFSDSKYERSVIYLYWVFYRNLCQINNI